MAILKSLYTKEFDMNTFERDFISEVAACNNGKWWTRNPSKGDKAFCLNGFINHYPDFIIHTEKGNTIILETKGDHLDAEKKIKLGNLWASKAGNNYRACLVYKNREVDGAYTIQGFLEVLRVL